MPAPQRRRGRHRRCRRGRGDHRRRNQPARPDEARGDGARPPRRHQPPRARRHRARGRWRRPDRRPGPQQRPRRRPYDTPRLSAAVPGAARRRQRPAAQQGDHRRQPAAADALLLFLRHGDALQQTRAGQRMPGDRRVQPHPCHPRRQRALHRHAPERHGRGAAGARRACRGRGCGRRHPHHRVAGALSPPRRHARTWKRRSRRATSSPRCTCRRRRAAGTSTARSATARPTPSRWSQWRLSCGWRAGASPAPPWPSAASLPHRGATRRSRRRLSAKLRPAALFDRAADILLREAKGRGANDFKLPLARRTLAAVLAEATGGDVR